MYKILVFVSIMCETFFLLFTFFVLSIDAARNEPQTSLAKEFGDPKNSKFVSPTLNELWAKQFLAFS
jgi:hypothetical protein